MNDLEYWGKWYTPQNQGTKIFGQLTFSNQTGIYLKLYGAFEDSSVEQAIKEYNMEIPQKNYPIILGVTTENKLFTLNDCTRVGYTTSIGSVASDERLSQVEEQYRIDYAFIDAHFLDQKEMVFYKADLQHQNFEDWAHTSGFKTQSAISQGNLEKYDASYQRPPKIVGKVPDGTISVIFSFHHKFSSPYEVSLHQTTHLQVELCEALSIADWRSKYIYHIQNLLSLATTRPHSITDLVVYSKQKITKITDDKSFETPIQVVFSQRYFEPKKTSRLHPSEMIFTLQDIRDDFSDKLSKWLQIADPVEFGGLCDLFFSVIYSPSIYLPHVFLNLVTAAESYHRRRFNRAALPEEEFKKRKDIVIRSAPPEYKDWLTGQFQFRNDLTFRERINEMIRFTAPVISPLVTDQDYFVKKVKNTRNLLVHNIEEREGEAANSQELHWITETLSYMIHTCLLTELGFSPDRCAALFSRNGRYQFAAKQAQKFAGE